MWVIVLKLEWLSHLLNLQKWWLLRDLEGAELETDDLDRRPLQLRLARGCFSVTSKGIRVISVYEIFLNLLLRFVSWFHVYTTQLKQYPLLILSFPLLHTRWRSPQVIFKIRIRYSHTVWKLIMPSPFHPWMKEQFVCDSGNCSTFCWWTWTPISKISW